MLEPPIRVVIIDDHAGVRAGIISFFAHTQDIVVVGEGETGADALRLMQTQKPDVMLLDVEMPVLSGEEVMKRMRGVGLNVKVLAVSSHDDLAHVFGMLNNGAAGYITKDEVPQFLLIAIRYIAGCPKTWLSPQVKKRIALLPI